MSDSQNFTQNYQVLQTIASKLSQSGEVDIDELIPMVDEASRAYQLCKSRLDAVEQALSERLDSNTTQHSSTQHEDGTSSEVPF